MNINWEDFDFEDFNNNDGMWSSSHTGATYNLNDLPSEKSEEELKYEAFNNTYKMLLGGEKVVIFFDKNKLIDKIINYFCDLEEYEKCAKLLKLKK